MFKNIIAAAQALTQNSGWPAYPRLPEELSYNFVVIDADSHNNWPDLMDAFLHQNDFNNENTNLLDDDGTLAVNMLKGAHVNILQTSWERISRVYVENDQECYITARPVNASNNLSYKFADNRRGSDQNMIATEEITVKMHLIIVRNPVVGKEGDFRHFLMPLMAANVPSVNTVQSLHLATESQKQIIHGILKSIEQKNNFGSDIFRVSPASFYALSGNSESYIESNKPLKLNHVFFKAGKYLLSPFGINTGYFSARSTSLLSTQRSNPSSPKLSPKSLQQSITTPKPPSIASNPPDIPSAEDTLEDTLFAAPQIVSENLLGLIRIIRISPVSAFQTETQYRCLYRPIVKKTSQRAPPEFKDVPCEERYKRWADAIAFSPAWGISTLAGRAASSLDLLAIDVILSRPPVTMVNAPQIVETILGIDVFDISFLDEWWTEASLQICMLAIDRVAKTYVVPSPGVLKPVSPSGFKVMLFQHPNQSLVQPPGRKITETIRVAINSLAPREENSSSPNQIHVIDTHRQIPEPEVIEKTHKKLDREYRVIQDYQPKKPGEIRLTFGNMVAPQVIFLDGMCHGRNYSTEMKGLFPATCLEAFNTIDQSNDLLEVKYLLTEISAEPKTIPERIDDSESTNNESNSSSRRPSSAFTPPALPPQLVETPKARASAGWKVIQNQVLSKSFSGSNSSLGSNGSDGIKSNKLDIWAFTAEHARIPGGLRKDASKSLNSISDIVTDQKREENVQFMSTAAVNKIDRQLPNASVDNIEDQSSTILTLQEANEEHTEPPVTSLKISEPPKSHIYSNETIKIVESIVFQSDVKKKNKETKIENLYEIVVQNDHLTDPYENRNEITFSIEVPAKSPESQLNGFGSGSQKPRIVLD
ncbi:hypothetical protein HK096_002770 [Nowakowskiella sp. JEL0078]|nr:hypothetical protein HK096_002770 [Nowakowskiella sp. JEL0078]